MAGVKLYFLALCILTVLTLTTCFPQNYNGYGNQFSQDWKDTSYWKKFDHRMKMMKEKLEQDAAKRKLEQENILKSVEQIEAGNPPTGINSHKSISLSANVMGKIFTVKTTIYSTGNDQAGAIRTVQTVDKGSEKKSGWINSIIWDGDRQRNEFSSINNSNEAISAKGGVYVNSRSGSVFSRQV